MTQSTDKSGSLAVTEGVDVAINNTKLISRWMYCLRTFPASDLDINHA